MKIENLLIQKLYYQMLRIRRVEEAVVKAYPKGEIRCPVHLSIGQEGVAVGVCAALTRNDTVMSAHRSHAHYLAKGGSLSAMIAEFYGKKTGCSGGWGGSQHLIDRTANFLGAVPIVAETIPIAVGVAFAMKSGKRIAYSGKISKSNHSDDKTKRFMSHVSRSPISVVFFGEGAIEEGVTHESLNFAVLKQLPVLFVCENNLYAVNTHMRDRQPAHTVRQLAAAHGMPTGCGNGNDAVEVYRKTQEVVNAIRKGKGPAFVEFTTYRLPEHCGPGIDHPAVRSAAEVTAWEKKSPIERLEGKIRKDENPGKSLRGFSRVKNEMEKRIKKEIGKAFAFAEKSPWPDWNQESRIMNQGS